MKLSEILTSEVHTITADKSVKTAGEKMDECKVGSLVVMEHAQVIGIITSRNVRTSHPNRLVADAMTAQPICATPDTSIFEALHVMQQHEIERLVVQKDQQLIGIVTRETVSASISMLVDPLTKLYRAPYIKHMTEHLIERRQPFWFLFVDMNNFGQINKQYGHTVGDLVLQHFSGKLLEHTLESDAVCRFGGDEFIVVTTDSREHASRLLERLSSPFHWEQIRYQSSIALYPNSTEDSPFSLTFSELVNHTSLVTSQIKKQAAMTAPR